MANSFLLLQIPTIFSNSDKFGVNIVAFLYLLKSLPTGSISIGILYLFAKAIIFLGLLMVPLP